MSRASVAAAVVLAVFVMALGMGSAIGAGKAQLSGTVRVSGAWAMYPMMVRWAGEFMKVNPQVRLDVSGGGAGKGAADALGGLVDIGMISRAIHPEELKKGGWWVPVVKDAVVPTTNAANPAAKELAAKGMTEQQFEALWIDGKQMTWGEVVGKPQLKVPVRVYTRADACGAADVWALYLGNKKQEDLKGLGVNNDPGVAEAVKRDKSGIGYNNAGYAYDPRTGRPVKGLMVIPIDQNGNGKVDKAESFYATRSAIAKAIADGRFPSPPARDLNLLTKGKPTGATAAFIRWILTDGQKYVQPEGFIVLPKAKLEGSLKKLK
jgi:phosphate transport system substrate-binding protein